MSDRRPSGHRTRHMPGWAHRAPLWACADSSGIRPGAFEPVEHLLPKQEPGCGLHTRRASRGLHITGRHALSEPIVNLRFKPSVTAFAQRHALRKFTFALKAPKMDLGIWNALLRAK